MLQNSRFTAFTVFELLRENQQGVKLTLPPIMVNKNPFFEHKLRS